MMERQRSLSFKPTRSLVFTFVICSSLTFISFFSVWVMRAAPSIHQRTRVQLKKPPFDFPRKPAISARNLTAFSRFYRASGAKTSVPAGTQIRKPKNISGFEISVLPEPGGKKNASEASGDPIKEGFVLNPATLHSSNQSNLAVSPEDMGISSSESMEGRKTGRCDVTRGNWVFDESYPLYKAGSCPFTDEGFDCEGNGRSNRDYMKWRWQPQDCDIPRFNATKMLNLIRGKRLVFVGDSINRNQWESMLCLLMAAVKDPRRVYETHRRRITKEKGNYSFRFLDYKCTIEYYVTHFLVHEGKTRLGRRRVPTLRIDAIDRGTARWRGADILVFNTAHWWSHYKTKAGVNYYQEGNVLHPHLDVSTAFRRAMTTWASWVDRHIDPSKTQVFFRSLAPAHFSGGQWNSGGHCEEATRPMNETWSVARSEKNAIAAEVIREMRTPVSFLNITSLSGYRVDGHPSVYGRKLGVRNRQDVEDCSHWCLPGVPDTWNELLYFYLQQKNTPGE